MKADINARGVLELTPENGAELIVLTLWSLGKARPTMIVADKSEKDQVLKFLSDGASEDPASEKKSNKKGKKAGSKNKEAETPQKTEPKDTKKTESETPKAVPPPVAEDKKPEAQDSDDKEGPVPAIGTDEAREALRWYSLNVGPDKALDLLTKHKDSNGEPIQMVSKLSAEQCRELYLEVQEVKEKGDV